MRNDELSIARAQVREQLLDAGVASVSFQVSAQPASRSIRLVMVDGIGIPVDTPALRAQVSRTLAAVVDAAAPGWDKGDGGRSEIDWAVKVDAFDHRHYDVVRFERSRALLAAPDPNRSGHDLASAALAAVQVAMGEQAPLQRDQLQRLRDGLVPVVEAARRDQLRFLDGAQRELLIEAAVGNRLCQDDADDWISEVVRHGFTGYETVPDSRLVQKLGSFTLDDMTDGLVGNSPGGEEHRELHRAALVAILTLRKSVEALEAVADLHGYEMLESLCEGGHLPARDEPQDDPFGESPTAL